MFVIKKIRGLHPGVKASMAFFLSSLIIKGLAFMTTPLYTRLLSTYEFGHVSVYYTWMQMFGILAMFCLSYGVFNCGMVDYPEKRTEFSFSLLILSNIITLCFTGILLCLYPFVKTYLNLDIPFIILMCCTFFFQPAYSFWVARQRYEMKYKVTVIVSILSAVISPAIAIICIMVSGSTDNVYPRVFGAEIPLLVLYICFYFMLAIRSKFKVNTCYWKDVLLFNIPLIPHYLSSYVLNSSDKLMISYFINDEATAFYSVAYSIASIALIFWNAVDSSLLPFTFEKLKRNEFDSINKVSIPLLAIFGCGCFVVILMGPEVIQILATNEYKEAIFAIPPVVGATFFQAQYLLFSNILYYYKKPKYVLFGSVSAVTANIVLNCIFIPRFGFLAAGYTTLVGFAIQACVDGIAMKKVCKHTIYSLKSIILLSGMVCAISIVSGFIYNSNIVRYLILAIYIVGLFAFRKKIIKLINSMKKEEGGKDE